PPSSTPLPYTTLFRSRFAHTKSKTRSSRGTSGQSHGTDYAGESFENARRRYGPRHGTKHGGLDPLPTDRSCRNHHHLASRGSARQSGKFLYRQSALA